MKKWNRLRKSINSTVHNWRYARLLRRCLWIPIVDGRLTPTDKHRLFMANDINGVKFIFIAKYVNDDDGVSLAGNNIGVPTNAIVTHYSNDIDKAKSWLKINNK